MRCAVCSKGTARSARIEMKRTVAGHVFTATVRGRVCDACDEAFFDDAVVARVDLAIARALVDADLGSGEAFRFVRKVVGLRANELAALLAVTKDITRGGRRVRCRSTAGPRRSLAMMLLDREAGVTATQDALRALSRPKPLRKQGGAQGRVAGAGPDQP